MITVDITPSPKKHKKYRAYFSNGVVVDFGSASYEDYTTHNDEDRKHRYMKRHKRDLQTFDVFKPGYLSWFILWTFPSLDRGIEYYQDYVLNSAEGEVITNPELFLDTSREEYELEMAIMDIPPFIDLECEELS